MAARHEKLLRGLDLIQRLSANRTGLTMAELCAASGVGRRTMERMLKAVGQACGGLEALSGHGKEKRWRIAPLPNRALAVTAEEMAALGDAAQCLEADGRLAQAALVRGAAEKLQVLSGPGGPAPPEAATAG